jgi:hypothetical protein
MISDVLFDSIHSIRKYLDNDLYRPMYAGKFGYEIQQLLDGMDRVRRMLDTPPADPKRKAARSREKPSDAIALAYDALDVCDGGMSEVIEAMSSHDRFVHALVKFETTATAFELASQAASDARARLAVLESRERYAAGEVQERLDMLNEARAETQPQQEAPPTTTTT